MTMSPHNRRVHFLLILILSESLAASGSQVSGQVSITPTSRRSRVAALAGVVVWLTPLVAQESPPPTSRQKSVHTQLVQRNKTFDPHILAVQVGSRVDFPNRDPFFHNVFSLFNGKRFDLGLYEAGSTRSVDFDRAGICYIFCNIHPQMSAVVVVIDTPYFTVSGSQGEIVIPDVPSGVYQMNLWEEHCASKTLEELSRKVIVGDEVVSLGSINLQESDEPFTTHFNKYGKPYDPEVFSSPLYRTR